MEIENPYKSISSTRSQVASVGVPLEKIRRYRNCVRGCLVLYGVGLFSVVMYEPVHPVVRLCFYLILLISALFVSLLGRLVYGGFAAFILLVLMPCLTPLCMLAVVDKAGALIRQEEKRWRMWGDLDSEG